MIAAIEFTDAEREIIQHIAASQERLIHAITFDQGLRPAVVREILRRIEDVR